MSESVFLAGLTIAAITLVMTARAIASAFSGRGARGEIGQLREELEEQAAALEDTKQIVNSQAAELAEIQERLDFTERVLAQNRDRAALKPGDKQD